MLFELVLHKYSSKITSGWMQYYTVSNRFYFKHINWFMINKNNVIIELDFLDISNISIVCENVN